MKSQLINITNISFRADFYRMTEEPIEIHFGSTKFLFFYALNVRVIEENCLHARVVFFSVITEMGKRYEILTEDFIR